MGRMSLGSLLLFIWSLQSTTGRVVQDSDDVWGDWSPCSRSCGVGVMYQDRYASCLDVTDGGKCAGPKRRQYRTCNIQDCPEGSVDFRFEQCAVFNNRTLEGENYNWVPHIPDGDICGLNCMPKGKYFYYKWADKVVDGTRCGQESYDICVNGTCQPLGCDLIMHSKAKEDKCRVCNGNGENCRTITGEYKDNGYDYKEFLIIPRSATNIMITEQSTYGHYLALSDEKGQYYFNGNYEITNPRTFKIAGALFRYERTSSGQETIRSLGPTSEPVHAVVLIREEFDNPAIKYEFSVPKHIKVLPKVSDFKWETGDYGACSASCAGGYQNRKVRCVRVRDQETVNPLECDQTGRPLKRRRCNTQACPSRWFISDWGSCSVTCGQGKQVRRIHCEHVIEGGEPVMIPDDKCSPPKPISKRTCMLNTYCPTWNAAKWTKCSKSCGEGKVRRTVRCQDISGDFLPDTNCNANNKPKTTDKCNLGPCTVKWIATNWSPCYPRCGKGISTRMVYCVSVNDEDQKYPSSLCDNSTRPTTRKECVDQGACKAMWHGSQWSKCTTSCGFGMQMRNVVCAIRQGRFLRVLSYKQCNSSYYMSKVKRCFKKPCQVGWYIHQWKPCSKTCGFGIRQREVTCMADSRVVPDGRWCNKKDKPVEFESCSVQDCSGSGVKPTDKAATTHHITTEITTPKQTTGKASTTIETPTTTTERPTTTEKPQVTTEKLVTTERLTTMKKTTTTERPTTTEKPTTERQTITEKPSTTVRPTTTEKLHTTETLTTTTEKPTKKLTTEAPTTTEKTTTIETKTTTETPTTTQAPTTTVTPTTTEMPSTTETPTTTEKTTTAEIPSTTTKVLITTKRPVTMETVALTTTKPPTKKTTTEKHTIAQTQTTTETPVLTEAKTTSVMSTTKVVLTEVPSTAQRPTTETHHTTQAVTRKRLSTSPQVKRTTHVTEEPTTQRTTRRLIVRKPDEPVPVSIVQPPNDVVRYVDSEVLMRCRATGVPPPRITWRKEMMPVSAMGDRFKILEDGTLQIYRVRPQDEGKYTCFAGNFVSPLVNASCKLTVIDPVVVTIKPSKKIEASVNEEVSLECIARGKPSPRVTWYKDGEIISSNTNQKSYELTITKATLDDSGTYECRADHDYGTDSKSIVVEINDTGFTAVIPTTKQVCSDNPELYCSIVKVIKDLCQNGFYKIKCCESCAQVKENDRQKRRSRGRA